VKKQRKETPRPRIRTRGTDFHTIENPPQNTPLTSYQLEVREKLAQVRPASDKLIRKEEFRKRKNVQIQIRRRVLRNQKYAGLTPKQREALKLCYQRYSKDPKVSIFTSIPKGTLRKYLREQPERFLIHGKMNRNRPALCRVGKRILISVDALHSFLKTKEMVPASVIEYPRAA